jgi:hypothetical protein
MKGGSYSFGSGEGRLEVSFTASAELAGVCAAGFVPSDVVVL